MIYFCWNYNQRETSISFKLGTKAKFWLGSQKVGTVLSKQKEYRLVQNDGIKQALLWFEYVMA